MIVRIPNISTCDDAFWDYQGWVEGALRSADLVLGTKAFGGLEPISEYIDPGFELGSADPALDMTSEEPNVHDHFDVRLADRDVSRSQS